MNSHNLLAELKRRNVYKVAVAYVVVAWLLIQAASILFPTFDAPPWAMKILVALLVLCFPVALVLSWAFEITPEGIKLESEIDPKKSITRKTGRKIVGLTSSTWIWVRHTFLLVATTKRSCNSAKHWRWIRAST